VTTALILFGLVLIALLWLLAREQRRLETTLDHEVSDAIDEARRTGADRPLMQHPEIDPVQCIGCGACVAACPEHDVLGLVGGRVAIVNGSHCIGHGRCAEVCPVGAIRIGLGRLTERDDIPRLSPMQETCVPGLFLAGEITGIALIRNAVEQGTRAVEEIARRTGARRGASVTEGAVDLCIVGAGPAGLAAALKAVECGLDHVLIDQEEGGGAIRHYPRQKLVMTQPVMLPLYGRLRRHEYRKEELIRVWEEALSAHPVRLRTGERLLRVEKREDGFRLETTRGEVRARHVLLALGRRGTPRKLGVEGEDLEKVAYRLVDAGLYRDRRVLVVGGGDSAVEAALALAVQPGNRVTLSYRKDAFFRVKPRNRDKLEVAADGLRVTVMLGSRVEAITPEAVRLRVKSDQGELSRILGNDFVFIFAGGVPPFKLLREAGVAFGGDARAGDGRGQEAAATGTR